MESILTIYSKMPFLGCLFGCLLGCLLCGLSVALAFITADTLLKVAEDSLIFLSCPS